MKTLLLLVLLSTTLAAPAAAAPQELPAAAYISGVVGHKQSLPLSCESRSAADLAAFWGISISETGFFNALPKSDNPDKGFVGDVYGKWGQVPPNPYGVHAKPVARLLRDYGLDAQAQYSLSWKALRTEIAEGRPVIVWVVGFVWSGTPETYTAQDGSTATVAAYEHTMILIGYDENNVYLVDAGSGSVQTHSVANFRASWAVLGNMAVTAVGSGGGVSDSESGSGATSGSSGGGGGGQSSGSATYVVQPGDYLTKLAAQWSTTWQQLAALNGIVWPYTIYPGQVLQTGQGEAAPAPKPTKTPKPDSAPAPGGGQATGGTYIVKAGEHLMMIARALGLDWREIANLNGLVSPYVLYPGQALKLPGGSGGGQSSGGGGGSQSGQTYTVQAGDYLVALARKFDTTWQDLAAANGIGWPYTIYPGQVLTIP
ncbi:MAG: LysM peptidoglycan-binding domain-containing protein [Chloroflexi bacterium]|nr:LysM peptidoglycan-binding domain-containing protein [Chloroflexota bacterium]